MNLKILLPTHVFLEKKVTKVIAHAQNGSFCLLPHHIDFVSALVPGLFSYESEKEPEVFLAIDEGTLVKCGSEVLVSTRKAVGGVNLGMLKDTVEHQFRVLDEQEKKTRASLARLEADFIRKFLEFGQ